jgi:hypothetical protein
MLPGDLYLIQAASAQVQNHMQREEFWATRAALKLYRCARHGCVWAKLWSALTGQPNTLFDLDAVRAASALLACHYDGVRTVPIDLVQGSEGRCHDFDTGFRPLQAHSRDRWVRIAMARLMRTPLPPVTLVLVGNRYFVIDGHHRISVAKALGQTEIDAEVTVCEFVGPLPWEQVTTAGIPVLVRNAARI